MDKFNETYLKGNEGIPGESGSGEPNYLRSKQNDIQRVANEEGYDLRNVMSIMDNFMRTVHEVQQLCRGKERELQELAKTVILASYGEILEGFDLDIQIVRMGGINFNDMNEAFTPDQEMEFKKRKIINTILQGEGINSKYILNLPECIEGLEEIFGPQRATHAINLFNRLSRLAQLKDWAIPPEQQARAMDMGGNQFGGKVKVRWNKNNESALFEDVNYGTIQVRAVDFPMCLHEAVKGIWEVISAHAIPEDKEMARLIKLHLDQLREEPEEWKYGPYIAADVRDFINENSEADKHPNMREFVFGEMVKLEPRDFLNLMKGILMKTAVARKKIDAMIKDIVDMLDDYNKQMVDYEHSGDEHDEPDDEHGNVMDEEQPEEEKVPETQSEEEDPSTWSPRVLQDEIDKALEDGDYDRVRKLTKYMKEGRQIYEAELEMIFEHKNPHTK